jgi:hypothetical protein
MSAVRQGLRACRGTLHLAACRLAAGTATPALAALSCASHSVPPSLALPVLAQVPAAVAFTHVRGFAAKPALQEVHDPDPNFFNEGCMHHACSMYQDARLCMCRTDASDSAAWHTEAVAHG